MRTHGSINHLMIIISLAGALILMACQSALVVLDPAVLMARTELRELQLNPLLAKQAPSAIREAEIALQAAEKPQADPALAAHLAYLARNKVKTAKAQALTRYSESQMKALVSQSNQVRQIPHSYESGKSISTFLTNEGKRHER